jgi:hypothetical protein
MQAYKVKGKIDGEGHLIITEPIVLSPGDVEVIVLQPSSSLETGSNSAQSQESLGQKHTSSIQAFRELFEKAPPIPTDFDPEQAKWEYLRDKYNL